MPRRLSLLQSSSLVGRRSASWSHKPSSSSIPTPSSSSTSTSTHNNCNTMPIAFDSIPQEVLENIAFYAVASNPIGPPRELAPLLLINRRLNAALSSASNPHLHSRIFACKFDSAALVRRLG